MLNLSLKLVLPLFQICYAATNYQVYSIPENEYNSEIHDAVKIDQNGRVHILSKTNPSLHSKTEISRRDLSEILKNLNRNSKKASWYETYHNSTEILNYYDDLIKDTNVKKSSIGKSLNNKDYWMYSWENQEVSASVIMTCTVHARE